MDVLDPESPPGPARVWAALQEEKSSLILIKSLLMGSASPAIEDSSVSFSTGMVWLQYLESRAIAPIISQQSVCVHTEFLLGWAGTEVPGRLPEFGDVNAGLWHGDKAVLLQGGCLQTPHQAQGQPRAQEPTQHTQTAPGCPLQPLLHPTKVAVPGLCLLSAAASVLKCGTAPKVKAGTMLSSPKWGSWPPGLVSFLGITKSNQQNPINDTKSWKSGDASQMLLNRAGC